jgi:hypothetical protein
MVTMIIERGEVRINRRAPVLVIDGTKRMKGSCRIKKNPIPTDDDSQQLT